MNRELLKMLLRSIRQSLGRYLSILGIIALGVGFFAGLKSSYPAMQSTAGRYFHDRKFHDFQLLSSLGFTDEDRAAFSTLAGVEAAEGARFADVYLMQSGKESVSHVMSLTHMVDVPELTAGRLPRNAGECVADSRFWSEKDLGATLALAPDNDEDTLSLFKRGSFKIVGLARSPRYISSDRGDTTLGAGRIDSFLYVLPETFDTDVWHEILLWCNLGGALYSEEYDDAHKRMESSVKELQNRLGAARRRALRAEADEKLADGRKELDEAWEEYRAEKKNTEQELANAMQKLVDGRAELDAGQAELDRGLAALNAGMAQIPGARREIEENRALLEGKRGELEEGRAQLEAGYAALAAAEAELAVGAAELEAYKAASMAPTLQRITVIQREIAALQNAIAAAEALPDGEEAAAPLRSQLGERQAELAAAQAELSEIEAGFAPQEAELAAGKEQIAAGLAELDASSAELEAGARELDAAEAQLDAAEAQLNAAEAAYPDRLREIEEGQQKLRDAEIELEIGLGEYHNGVREAEEGFREAEEKLHDAEEVLADAAAEADERLKLQLYTIGRETNPGYLTFDNDTRIIDALSDVFPLFFVLVAALVCITTMTRMVGEERTLIGTMKAMGYSSFATMSKYLLYASSAALLGCVIGFFAGTVLIPYLVWFAYGILYDYAKLDFFFSPLMAALCLLVTVPGALLVTYLVCRREGRERPAELIRPKAPKKGKKILLERVTFLWRRLPFHSRLSLRNAFRFPTRVAMLLLGIGGCTALLLAGLGARDSIAHISSYQYDEIMLYDLEVNLDTDEAAAAETALLWEGETERCALTRQETVTVENGGRKKETRLIAAAPGALEGLIDLHDKSGAIAWPQAGEAVITEKIAESTGLAVGDRFSLTRDGGEVLTLTVTGVCENYLRHFVFTASDPVGEGKENTALLLAAPDTDPAALGASLRAGKGVSYVSETRQERETMENSMRSMDLLIALIVVCSGALAFITLYNLTNINLMERTREIATVKVLGFYRRETAAYVLRENVTLSVLGAALGLVLGKGLHAIIIRALVVEYMSFSNRVSPWSYVLAYAVTIVFTLLTNAFMRRRLDTVDMAESLKSVE